MLRAAKMALTPYTGVLSVPTKNLTSHISGRERMSAKSVVKPLSFFTVMLSTVPGRELLRPSPMRKDSFGQPKSSSSKLLENREDLSDSWERNTLDKSPMELESEKRLSEESTWNMIVQGGLERFVYSRRPNEGYD